MNQCPLCGQAIRTATLQGVEGCCSVLFSSRSSDSCSKSGAGVVGTENYVTEASMCAPSVESFDEFGLRAEGAYNLANGSLPKRDVE